MVAGERFIGRRQMIATAGLAAAGGAAALACSSDDKEERAAVAPAAGASAAAAPKTPRRGGTLTVDAEGEPLPTNLVYGFAKSNVYIRWGVWDSLVYLDHEGKLRPMLAETFEMRPDYTGVHITLRPGVEFHSGRPLTAEDVKYSIEAFTPDNVTSQIKPAMKQIKEITIADERSLDIVWGLPRPLYEDYFAMLPILDRETLAQHRDMKVLVGTGPFKFISYTPQQGYLLERNPNYWDQGKPYLDRIQGKLYVDEQTRVLALQSGDLMHHTSATYATVKKLRGNRETTIIDSGVAGNHLLGFVVTYPPLRDVRVRQALTLAIDRERIAKDWAEGLVTAQVLPWPKGTPGDIVEDETLLRYDPERAKSLLKQAGVEGFTLPTDTTPADMDLLQYVQDMWKAIGVNQQLNPMEQSSYTERHRQRKFEASWGVQNVVAFNALHAATVLDAGAIFTIPNVSSYEPPGYKSLLEKLLSADPRTAQGKDLLHQWNRRFLIDDPWMVPLGPVTVFDVMRKEVFALPSGRGPGKRPPLSDMWIDG